MVWRIGVDIGGTFTDVAVVEEASGHIGVAKVLSTPGGLAEGAIAPAAAGATVIIVTPGSAYAAPPVASGYYNYAPGYSGGYGWGVTAAGVPGGSRRNTGLRRATPSAANCRSDPLAGMMPLAI